MLLDKGRSPPIRYVPRVVSVARVSFYFMKVLHFCFLSVVTLFIHHDEVPFLLTM